MTPTSSLWLAAAVNNWSHATLPSLFLSWSSSCIECTAADLWPLILTQTRPLLLLSVQIAWCTLDMINVLLPVSDETGGVPDLIVFVITPAWQIWVFSSFFCGPQTEHVSRSPSFFSWGVISEKTTVNRRVTRPLLYCTLCPDLLITWTI